MKRAVILSVPRFAAIRPQAAPAIIKTILNTHSIENKIFDINLDFQKNLKEKMEYEKWIKIDDWMYLDSYLDHDIQRTFDDYLDIWIDKIIKYKADYIFLSVFCWQCQKFTRKFLSMLRPRTNAKIIIGGQGLINEENGTWAKEPYFAIECKKLGIIDHWIRGEAESTIPEIVKGNFKAKGIDSNQWATFSEIDTHQPMDFSDTDPNNYPGGYTGGVLPIESSRGCIRRCVFCDIPTVHGGFRWKDGYKLANEMIHYYENHKAKNFLFNDAACNGSMKEFRKFNENLINYYQKNNLGARYFGYTSHSMIRSKKNMVPLDYELMAEAGADTMVIGIESGSQKVRDDMKKQSSDEDIDYSFEQYSKNKIKVYMLMITGFPTETEEDFEQTLRMLDRYQNYVADGTIVGINCGTTLTIEEGSPIMSKIKDWNIVSTKGPGVLPNGADWISLDNPSLTYKARILRRIKLQEYAHNLGYTVWKGNDQLKIMKNKYEQKLTTLQGLIH